jgi:hypothetical protein
MIANSAVKRSAQGRAQRIAFPETAARARVARSEQATNRASCWQGAKKGPLQDSGPRAGHRWSERGKSCSSRRTCRQLTNEWPRIGSLIAGSSLPPRLVQQRGACRVKPPFGLPAVMPPKREIFREQNGKSFARVACQKCDAQFRPIEKLYVRRARL